MHRPETGKSLQGPKPPVGPGSRRRGGRPEDAGCEPAPPLRRPPSLENAYSVPQTEKIQICTKLIIMRISPMCASTTHHLL